MMKRRLYNIQFLLLFAILLQMVLSCSETEELESQSVDVTFTTAVQSGVQTRANDGNFAYGSGKYATTLLVAVFNNDEIPKIIGEPQEFEINPLSSLGNNVTINLTKNQTYNIIFWAYNKETDAYDFKELPEVIMKAPVNVLTFEQADAMDAFYAVVQYTAGNTPEPISLKRSLAQINVGTSGTSVPVSFTIKNAATKCNLFDGTLSNEEDFTWTFREVASESFSIKVDDTQYATYNYLAMGYLFAPLGKGTEVIWKTCLLKLANTDKEIPPFQNVELRANCRSNIVGSFTEY